MADREISEAPLAAALSWSSQVAVPPAGTSLGAQDSACVALVMGEPPFPGFVGTFADEMVAEYDLVPPAFAVTVTGPA